MPLESSKEKEDHGQSVSRVAQDNNQPLHLRRFDQQEPEADGGKKPEQRSAAAEFPAFGGPRQRQDDAERREDGDDEEQQPEHEYRAHVVRLLPVVLQLQVEKVRHAKLIEERNGLSSVGGEMLIG